MYRTGSPSPASQPRPRRPGRRIEPPLYDARYEHDACGIGFVADAGGRSADRVLSLALGGLASLGHRGAFAADGASSDGAGVLLPLSPSVLALIDPRQLAGEHPGVLTVFAPEGPTAAVQAKALVEAAAAAEGTTIAHWRRVPVKGSALGPEALGSLPAIHQVLVARPAAADAGADARADAAFELALACVRRRAEAAARAAGLQGFAVVSASSRTLVYKGLVAGAALPTLFPDLAAPLEVPFAVFHQRYATNTHPVWALAQPFGFLAHNGEINTVRGNREAVRGREADSGVPARHRDAATRLRAAGPLLSPDVSDSRTLDEALELLMATGWSLEMAVLALVPEATALRRTPNPAVSAFRRRTAGFIAPWDGPAALVFADGRRVGALLDRNGLRPAAWAVTKDGLVSLASESGAIPLSPSEIVRSGRLSPGEMLLVDPAARKVYADAEAKQHVLRRLPLHDAPREAFADTLDATAAGEATAPGDATATGDATRSAEATAPGLRHLFGLDAERLRLDVRTMALDAHEPLWSMGDDTPLAGRARVSRPASDHLRQAFAQVTNPPIDPERERAVMDLRVELGLRPALLGGLPSAPTTLRLERPTVVDLDGLLAQVRDRARGRASKRRAGSRGTERRGAIETLDATWPESAGPDGLAAALGALAEQALDAARAGVELLVVSDARAALGPNAGDACFPIPSVLAGGAVHTALTRAGLRGRTDLVVDAGDILDVHGFAMALAVGATAVHPRLLLELGREQAGTRGAESLTAADAVANTVASIDAGLRKVLARMGISTVASYVGGQLFETLELGPEIVARCFPAAAAWPGRLEARDLAAVQLSRIAGSRALATTARQDRLPDPGLARFRGDGEHHLFAPAVAGAIQALAGDGGGDPAAALDAYRQSLTRDPAVVRDGFRITRPDGRPPVPVAEVEDARSIARRFVVSAMSVGALSPEAHRVLTLGIQALGGAANTGEGGEDPAWYAPGPDGLPTDAKIKQVASARFGVTAAYLARAEQLEIKMAQGSKPGEGGQLPGRKTTVYIAALRRAQAGQTLVSPPPHHDIYSIEDLAQLIADLRAINPRARIGVKLVASRGVGTIASGVAKAGADYVHLSGHSGGTGASPLSSIKHVGAPWELGLAEVHQSLLRNNLRDRVTLRTDGGLQTGRDLLIAALIGAEEFAFGTGALVAVGCDMARQCHLDTCPTGIATQREDLRAKFTGTPEQVVRYFTAIAEDLRVSLAAIGARSIGEVVGEGRRFLTEEPGSTIDLRALLAPSWGASAGRRAAPATASAGIAREAASPLESGLVTLLRGQGGALGMSGIRISTAERSFGAALTGAVERGDLAGPVRLELRGYAGQSFGAWLGPRVSLLLEGAANDYVGKGLSGGSIVVRPSPDGRAALAAAQATADGAASSFTLAGNTCLYGATGGSLHVVGRAGMRFAIRNSGAEAVVEGLGPHGCEYMTGGVVVVLGSIGPSFGAGMTGGRAYLWDPEGRHAGALHGASVRAIRLADVVGREAGDGEVRIAELHRLLEAHRDAGSALAGRLLDEGDGLAADMWLVEPVGDRVPTAGTTTGATTDEVTDRVPATVGSAQPNRNRAVA